MSGPVDPVRPLDLAQRVVEKAKAAGYTELHSLEVDDKSWEGTGLKADGKKYEFQMEGKTGKIMLDEID